MSQSKRSAKDKYLDTLKTRYAQAIKQERGKILDEYVQTTGYHRKHAIAILSGRYQPGKRPFRRPRKTIYTAEDAKALGFLSDLFDGINAKRLRAALDVELEGLYRRGMLPVSRASYRRLQHISPASIDRLRAQYGPPRPKSRHRTKPGTLLKSQIPIRTWADWNEDQSGFVEMDLVGHDGGNLRGDYCLTLNFTDVKTGWTESVAVRNKAPIHVLAAIRLARSRLPFPLLGLDSDNGSEFINDQLLPYCSDEHLTFTRGRVGHKNDNPHVEHKNFTAVRHFVGDLRYDTPRHLKLLNALYDRLHLFLNFFIPTLKLKEKIRSGSKVKRIYDEPQTPSARVLASPHISTLGKAKLRAQYAQLELVQLKREMDALLDQLWQDPHRS